MLPPQTSDQSDEQEGARAEEVVGWYFRLNGFMSIPGFVIHPDAVRRHARTEADLLGVRFPYSMEVIDDRQMRDDGRFRDVRKILFIMAEVKVGLCSVNGPWSRREDANMQRAIRRLGFAREDQVTAIADAMYAKLRWEGPDHVLQYVAVGGRKNHQLQRTYGGLEQITWTGIGTFLFTRFSEFPMKLRDGGRAHSQWPNFGRDYGGWFHEMGQREPSDEPVHRYIKTGCCLPDRARHAAQPPHPKPPANRRSDR